MNTKQQSIKYFFLILLIAVLVIPSVALAAWWNPLSWNWNIFNWFSKPTTIQTPVACPMLAKLCPDGSSVSPQGQKCEFPACPIVQNFALSLVNNKIEIKDQQTGKLIQATPLTRDVTAFSGNLKLKDIASLENDINFDGYKDLMLLTQIPADNPGIYDFYIYDPSTQKFNKDPILQNLVGPNFNPKTKTIETYTSEGCAGGNYIKGTFSFVNGNYTFTQQEEGNCCTADNNNPNITVNKFENGKKVSTIQKPCPPQ